MNNSALAAILMVICSIGVILWYFAAIYTKGKVLLLLLGVGVLFCISPWIVVVALARASYSEEPGFN